MVDPVELGLALWNMQSTAAAPANLTGLYREVVDDARHVEGLGFTSLWLGEHRFWYDGWCPSPLTVAAAITAATERLHVGTAMLLLPQHDPVAVARDAAVVHGMSGGRLHLGVGLGYRDEEFDGLGISRSRRGETMTSHLDTLLAEWSSRTSGDLDVWVGGMADAALRRAADRGLAVLLPSTLEPDRVAQVAGRLHAVAKDSGRSPGKLGIIKDVWVERSRQAAHEFFLPRMEAMYTEYGAWWVFKGRHVGLERPDLVRLQVERAIGTAIVGNPDDIVSRIAQYRDAGVDLMLLHTHRDRTRGHDWMRSTRLLADHVLPRVAA
jgi:alkanesulfonate monooxygenase SsuD/methylene tetrahydromethanopterin reductase-like flavin-dependent oxidoreductase (luciferase family)